MAVSKIQLPKAGNSHLYSKAKVITHGYRVKSSVSLVLVNVHRKHSHALHNAIHNSFTVISLQHPGKTLKRASSYLLFCLGCLGEAMGEEGLGGIGG